MRTRLDTEDRRAVDLLLERANGIGDTPAVEQLFKAPVLGNFEKRIDAVDRVLELLGNMPAEDPPADLVSRTLQRIAEFDAHGRAKVPAHRVAVHVQRPHA
jgi:hypothetical protein